MIHHASVAGGPEVQVVNSEARENLSAWVGSLEVAVGGERLAKTIGPREAGAPIHSCLPLLGGLCGNPLLDLPSAAEIKSSSRWPPASSRKVPTTLKIGSM